MAPPSYGAGAYGGAYGQPPPYGASQQSQPPPQQQRQQRESRPTPGNPPSVKAPYRGMFVPEPEEHESYDAPQQAPPPRQQAARRAAPAAHQPPPQQRQPPPQQQQQAAPRYSEQPVQNKAGVSIDDVPVGALATDNEEIPEFAPAVMLQACDTCGRKFNADSLAKHVNVCQKVFQSKRKAFNMTEARLSDALQNPDDARVVKDVLRAAKPGAPAGKALSSADKAKADKKAKWKQQSAALREAMKYNKVISEAQAQGKDLKSLPPPPVDTIMTSDYVNCPTCGRNFNAQAGERHIPKCKDMKAKPSRLVRGGGVNSSMRVQPKSATSKW